MKLVSYEVSGHSGVRLGVMCAADTQNYIVDVAKVQRRTTSLRDDPPIPNDMCSFLSLGEPGLAAVRGVIASAVSALGSEKTARDWIENELLFPESSVRLLPPIPRPGKIIMVGSNYKAHASEAGAQADKLPAARNEQYAWPVAFSKFPSVLVGHLHPIVYPRNTTQLDYEAELCVVIGKRCKDVPEERADEVIAGYTIANDVSMRDLQFAEMRRGSIMMGKNLDTASPMGPYLVTSDEIPDPQDLQIRCWVNGEVRQNDSTKNMTFSVRWLVSYFSRMTLEPGDVIATGTPAGVGIFWNPPEAALLRVGDVVDLEIERIGRLSNTVVAEPAA